MARKPHKRLIRYSTKYTLNGAANTLVYVRSLYPGDKALADGMNGSNQDAVAEYNAACELGLASDVKTTAEELLA